VKWDDNRRPHVADPSEKWVDDYLHDQAAGRIPDADTRLATLWGIRCAYPELEYVKTALDTARADWIKETGVSAETEIAWHTLLADVKKSDAERGASCPNGDSWHVEDPAHLARQYHLCGGLGPEKATAKLLETMDAKPDPIVSAGVVGFCPRIITHDGVGSLMDGAYWTWKLCDRVGASDTGAELDEALRAAGVSDWVRLAYTAKAEKGRAEIERDRARFTKLEGGWPGLRAMWDGSVTQVDEKYAPILAK
jgi:hypothetical protein